jgi:catechol 2,3-dioxygenase-like lactoylglutathione lyase family enzyme
MLEDGEVAARLPARDLERARAFYAEKLGLEPVEERPGGLRYRCGNSYFAVFQSAGAASGTHTQMGWGRLPTSRRPSERCVPAGWCSRNTICRGSKR